MGLFDVLKPKAKPSVPARYSTPGSGYSAPDAQASRKPTTKEYLLAGGHYHSREILAVAPMQSLWRKPDAEVAQDPKLAGRRIYQFRRAEKPAQLVPEPNNAHDRNAVKVMVDGRHIGYISSDDNVQVLGILRRRTVQDVVCAFSGGTYKVVYPDGEAQVYESLPRVLISVTYI